MPGVLITVFQIIGIVFACVGGFIVFAMVTPFTYRADVAYHGTPDVDVKASWLLGILRIFVTYTDDKPKILVKVLMFTVFDSTKKKKKKKKKKSRKKGKTGALARTGKKKLPKDDDSKPFEVEDEDDDTHEKSLREKFIAVMDKITGFIRGALDKIGTALEWLDADHRRLYGFLWTNGMKILKKVKPKEFNARIAGGTGDPATTGMIVSYASIGLGLAGIDTVKLEPDFENKGIDADVDAKGYFFVFPVILIALKIYFNKDFRRFILKKQ